MKNKLSFISLFIVLIVCIWTVTNKGAYKGEEKVIQWDIISYYGYLPATFIYKDISLSYINTDSIAERVINKTWYSKAPNGGRIFKMSMGVAIMCTPCFLVAHWLAPTFGYDADGYTTPYAVSIIASSILALLIGLYFLRKLLLKYYSDWICTFTLLIVALATNLFWYTTEEAGMSHVFNFCLFSIFLYLTEKWYAMPSYKTSIFLGLTAGLVSLIRPTNCIVCILFVLWNITSIDSVKARLQLYKKHIWKLVIIIPFVLLVWVPQIAYWKYLTGQWFFYSYLDEHFFFNDPRILNVLFGFRKGWFIYTPSMIFAFIGLILLWKYNKKWALASSVFFIVNLYIVSSWWCWWYGGSLGMRALIDSYPIMAIGLACFLKWILGQKLIIKIFLVLLVASASAQTIYHHVQYHYGVLHHDAMTYKAYKTLFWKIHVPEKAFGEKKEPDYAAAKNGSNRGE